MRPLKEMPLTLVKSIRFILCDIDDTLTVEGTLPAETFTMLHRLKESDFCVIPVTGRPAGWCDHIARFGLSMESWVKMEHFIFVMTQIPKK